MAKWASQVAGVERTCDICGGDEKKALIFQYANQTSSGAWDTYKAHLACAGSENITTPRPEKKNYGDKVRVKPKEQ